MKKKVRKIIKRVSPSKLNWDESRDNFIRKHNGGSFKTQRDIRARSTKERGEEKQRWVKLCRQLRCE